MCSLWLATRLSHTEVYLSRRSYNKLQLFCLGVKTLNTDFGKKVKKKLIDIDKRQNWLIDEVKKRTGMFLDVSYFQKIMRGERNPQKIVTAICEILDIEEVK